MKTGEGKTLVATLAAYLNALSAAKVYMWLRSTIIWHRRDSEWMGRLYGFLGLTTGVILHGLTDEATS
jgi:preprotein translocase subunit SecA